MPLNDADACGLPLNDTDACGVEAALWEALGVTRNEPLRLILRRRDQVAVVLHATIQSVGGLSSPTAGVLLLREDASHEPGLNLDSTQQETQSEQLRLSEERYAKLFYESPISLWESDCGALSQQLDQLRASGIADVAAWLREDLTRCLPLANAIRVIDVNQGTLDLFGGSSAADNFR